VITTQAFNGWKSLLLQPTARSLLRAS